MVKTRARRSAKPTTILLGYESGTGNPVHVPLHHLLVTGTTQLSGKTTTLEALLVRSELTAVAFKTKRGEASFSTSSVARHQPYFRERADWQYVERLLQATMRERMKVERSFVIQTTRGARSLRDVKKNVEERLETERRGFDKSVLTNLNAYLDIVIPQIEAADFAKELRLQPGLNVMDLVGLSEEVQALVIASTMDAVFEDEPNTIVVMPEAWKFIPEGRNTPVTEPAIQIVREGAARGILLWVDSQDITGVDKTVLKQVDVWLLGRQREKNEVERSIAQLPLPKAQRPKPEEIMRLRVGHFIVAAGNDPVRTVYVKPAWLAPEAAVKIAKTGDVDAARIFAPERAEDEEENDVGLKEKLQESEAERRKLEAQIAKLEAAQRGAAPATKTASAKRGATSARAPAAERSDDEEDDANGSERKEYHLDVDVRVPRLTIRERVVHVAATNEDNRGRGALLIAEGFFDSPVSVNAACAEYRARGWGTWSGGAGAANMGRVLLDLTTMGFLRLDGKTFVAVPEAKERIERVKETVRR